MHIPSFSDLQARRSESEAAAAIRRGVYSCLHVPLALERPMFLVLLIIADCMLWLCTIFPARIAVSAFRCGQALLQSGRQKSVLVAEAHIVDLARAATLLLASLCLRAILNVPRLYHFIRRQSVMKTVALFNALELADKLLSSLGVDLASALIYSSSTLVTALRRPRGAPSRATLSTAVHRLVADVLLSSGHVCLHAYTATAHILCLAVSVHSWGSPFVALIISAKIAELKASALKKFDAAGTFQIVLADAYGRFFGLLFVFVSLCESLADIDWTLQPGILALQPALAGAGRVLFLVFGTDVVVDWIKHVFVAKNNNLPPSLYDLDFRAALVQDIRAPRTAEMMRDPLQLMARRIGFSPLALCLVICHVVLPPLASFSAAAFTWRSPFGPRFTSLLSRVASAPFFTGKGPVVAVSAALLRCVAQTLLHWRHLVMCILWISALWALKILTTVLLLQASARFAAAHPQALAACAPGTGLHGVERYRLHGKRIP
jgi:hypothetical protein